MSVAFENDCIVVGLSDGRTISVPVAWYDDLWDEDDKDLRQCEVMGRGSALYWPTLQQAIPTSWIVEGRQG